MNVSCAPRVAVFCGHLNCVKFAAGWVFVALVIESVPLVVSVASVEGVGPLTLQYGCIIRLAP